MDDVIKDYIFQCEEVLESKDLHKAEELINKIEGAFESQIKGISQGLDSNTSYLGNHQVDFLGDVAVLKDRLSAYLGQKRDPKTDSVPDIDISVLLQEVRDKVELDKSLSQHKTREILSKLKEIEDILAAK
jgi:hypothetical protein